MDTALINYAAIGALLSTLLHLLVHWVSLCATTTKCKAALLAWSDGFYNYAVLCFGLSVLFAAVGIAMGDWSQFILACGVFAVVSGCISAALRAISDRLDKNERRVAAGS